MLGDLARNTRILKLALPIIGAMLSQSLLNLIDAALVGSLGETALAGVGIGGYAMFMVTALIFGLSSAVQAQTSRRLGEEAPERCGEGLNAGLVLALSIGIPVTLACHHWAEPLLSLINDQPGVHETAASYFQWRVLGLIPVAMAFCFRGFWNGLQRTGIYLRIMLITQAVNVVLSIILIHGLFGAPQMGADGAGAGTTLSLLVALALWIKATLGERSLHGVLHAWPPMTHYLTLLKLAVPHSFQQLWFAAGYAMLFWILGQIDAASVAVGHVLVNLSLLLILPGVGLGLAAMSLVGQALGSGEHEEAHRWGWDTVRVALPCLLLLGLPLWVAPESVLGLFLHRPPLIELGLLPLQMTAAMIVLDCTAIVLAQALLGAGAHRTVMLATLSLQWLIFLPAAWWWGVHQEGGLVAIWAIQLAYRLLNSLVFGLIWQRRAWQALRL
ncbi:MATE family efflux transporter [Cobetia marina]|uniref:MATE family efflux transporter n=1 Tax=Cobetia marina TaxID=28258 RepID=UPI0010ADC4DC|nr:MATE family efflux transporter [Cobetia marina]TKD63855.1 MATE family efflux transporter [Cobetia marina]GED40896.1 MATE family efflux transporter [Cobetia marina]